MQRIMEIVNMIVQYVFLMIIVNMAIILISLISFGLLAPFSIYIGFVILNAFVRKERLLINKINFKASGLITIISYVEFIIIYQYIKVLPYASLLSFETVVYVAFGIICVYFYIFNTYFMFLSTKNIGIKELLLLSVIAPFHSIKQSALLALMLVISIGFLLKFSSLLLLIGATLLLVLNNLILESYYLTIKE